MRSIIDGRNVSKNVKEYFAKSRKPPEANERKIKTGNFFPAEWETFLEKGLRARIFRKSPGFNILLEIKRKIEKQNMYAKIKG
ncbi:MAG TPA: hypothetical protein VN278_08000 [Methanosarcina sp.]|nr:hypothetical protein [Methanosarcina sp.]